MKLKVALALLLAAAAFFTVGRREAARRMNRVNSPPPYTVSPLVTKFHQTLFIADLHADSLLWKRDLLDHGSYGHLDVPRLLQGNVALQVFSVVTRVPLNIKIAGGTATHHFDRISLLAVSHLWPPSTWGSLKQRALYQSRKLHELAARSGGKFLIVKSRKDLARYVEQRNHDRNLAAGFLGIEGAHSLEGRSDNVDVLFAAGFRMIGLTHFFDNELGGSAHGELKNGLSNFGREVVQRMENLKMTVDLAHASDHLMDDVLNMTRRPVIVSHTGVRGTCDNQRNLKDAAIRRVAATGGLIGIGYWPTAVCGDDAAAIVRAIRYAVDLVGPDHVALGSDFDGAVQTPFDATGLVKITGGLLKHRFAEAEIRKIMGENVLRFLAATLP
ncbi:MAG: dipeptidase [Candidatus Binatia bacterium]